MKTRMDSNFSHSHLIKYLRSTYYVLETQECPYLQGASVLVKGNKHKPQGQITTSKKDRKIQHGFSYSGPGL